MKTLAACLVLAPCLALAHGGEEHQHEEEAPPLSFSASSGGSFEVASAAYELVVKSAPEGKGVSFTAFLSDFRTNEPLRKAEVTLELLGSEPLKVKLEESASAGLYRGVARVSPDATVDVIAQVRTSTAVDLFTVNGFALHPEAKEAAEAHGRPRTLWHLLLGIAVLGTAAIVYLSTRRGSAAVVVLLAGLTGTARAHGGEEHQEEHHEEPRATAPQAGAIHFPKEAQFLLGVRTLPAAPRQLQARLKVLGRVVPRADGHAELRAPQPGRVVAIGGKLPVIGDRVKASQALFAIEQALGATERSELTTRSVSASAALRQANARLVQAEQELARLKSLPGIASERELRAAEVALEVAREERNRARAEVELYQSSPGGLGRQVIASPLEGVVVEAHISAGEQVSTERMLVRVVDLSRLWIQAEIYERDLPLVAQNTGGLLKVEGYPKELFEARLFRSGQAVNETTRTATTLFELENPDAKLKVGMLGELAVALGEAEASLSVPDSAVVEQEGRRFVYVHTAPEWFEPREVRLGRRDGAQVEVLAGLSPGERVVTEGAYSIRTAAR
ncbi:MAG: efflux RND transporter periplasmic adaptor subunit [Myxococcales bacterium]|nr:efflux RND transporter periplasmic adaptor subunit [Myxococcales bacterium]